MIHLIHSLDWVKTTKKVELWLYKTYNLLNSPSRQSLPYPFMETSHIPWEVICDIVISCFRWHRDVLGYQELQWHAAAIWRKWQRADRDATAQGPWWFYFQGRLGFSKENSIQWAWVRHATPRHVPIAAQQQPNCTSFSSPSLPGTVAFSIVYFAATRIDSSCSSWQCVLNQSILASCGKGCLSTVQVLRDTADESPFRSNPSVSLPLDHVGLVLTICYIYEAGVGIMLPIKWHLYKYKLLLFFSLIRLGIHKD